MLTYLYQWLASVGYEHPIHPAFTHLPIGAVFAAWVFAALGVLKKRRELQLASFYCASLALFVLLPTMLLGLADWQHYYADALISAIRYKIILASCLAIGLLVVIVIHIAAKRARTLDFVNLLLMTINMAIVVYIGFLGGNLVFGGKHPAAPSQYQAGAALFESNCMGCHARGGNVLEPNLPLLTAPQLVTEVEFMAFLRKPHMPNSTTGEMPNFDKTKLSNQDAATLYRYITDVLQKPPTPVSKE